MRHLTCCAFAALGVPDYSTLVGSPQTPALPTAFGIVDAAVEPARVKAHRIGNAESNPFFCGGLKHQQSVGTRAIDHLHVVPKAKHPVAIGPIQVKPVRDRVGLALEFRAGRLVQSPSFRAMLSRCGGTVEDFAFAT